jgi:hypothetical protein
LLKLEFKGSSSEAGHRRFASQELLSKGGKKSRLVIGSARVKSEEEVRNQALVGLRKAFGADSVPRSSDHWALLFMNISKTLAHLISTIFGREPLSD